MAREFELGLKVINEKGKRFTIKLPEADSTVDREILDEYFHDIVEAKGISVGNAVAKKVDDIQGIMKYSWRSLSKEENDLLDSKEAAAEAKRIAWLKKRENKPGPGSNPPPQPGPVVNPTPKPGPAPAPAPQP